MRMSNFAFVSSQKVLDEFLLNFVSVAYTYFFKVFIFFCCFPLSLLIRLFSFIVDRPIFKVVGEMYIKVTIERVSESCFYPILPDFRKHLHSGRFPDFAVCPSGKSNV